MIRGGVLKVVRSQEYPQWNGIYVDLGNLTWMKAPIIQQEIIDYWKSQGYAEPELLPYIYEDNCLTVTRDLPDYSFLKGTDTLDEQVYNIPF